MNQENTNKLLSYHKENGLEYVIWDRYPDIKHMILKKDAKSLKKSFNVFMDFVNHVFEQEYNELVPKN